jgi:hypothetical protein
MGADDIKIKDSDYRIIPIEIPYKNLFFHIDCYNYLMENSSIIKFINDNFDYIFNKK